MNHLTSPEVILSLAKITALLLVSFALAPLLQNPTHRARLWTTNILILPLLFFSSFTTPLLQLIPNTKNQPETNQPNTPLTFDNPSSSYSEDSTSVIFPTSTAPTLLFSNPEDLTPPLDSTPPTTTSELSSISEGQLEQTPQTAFPWILTILISGMIISLLPYLLTTLRLSRLSKSPPLDLPYSLWKKIHQSSRRTPPLSFTQSPAAPFTYGILRPQVLLPDDSPTWPTRRLQSTLLHESAHIQRRDPLVRFFATLIRAVFWFHPLVWLANRQLISAQEQACDQHALAHGISPDDYAEDLLASATHSHLTPSEALSMAKWSQLGNRIHHILKKPKSNNPMTTLITTSIALTSALMLTTIGFSQETSKPSQAEPNSTDKSLITRGAILDRNNTPLAIDQNDQRTYPFGKTAAHITGFVTGSKPALAGLEKSLNAQLSKKEDIKLTLDAKLQEQCYKILEDQKKPGVIIVQNPNTGEILSLTSYPSYDPNLFVPFINTHDFQLLRKDEEKPLFPRATHEVYAPGASINPFIALAGEYAGLKNPEIYCKDSMTFGTNRNISIRDWKRDRDEMMRIPRALQTSCNTYFMELAIQAGKEPLEELGNLLHLNEPLLPILHSQKGFWMTRYDKDHQISRIDIALAAVGQGYTTLSPLHINAITSALATGSWHQPHLISDQKMTYPSINLVGQGHITEDSLAQIRKGLYLAVNESGGTARKAALDKILIAGKSGKLRTPEGTAKRVEVKGLTVAGKTGTAQLGTQQTLAYLSWFTGYAPFEKPEYAITVMLEGPNSGGKFAAPIASKIINNLTRDFHKKLSTNQ